MFLSLFNFIFYIVLKIGKSGIIILFYVQLWKLKQQPKSTLRPLSLDQSC
jgi:hypothetical protein